MALRDVNRKLKKIDDHCELVNNRDGYLYFEYADPRKNIFETKSVYVCYFKDNTDDEWVAEGKEFIEEVLSRIS
jgi:hypothetical protein